MMVDIVVNETSNLGLTVLILAAAIILGVWLDRNVFNKDRYK